ncbi:MAG: hypothetical protein OEZ47_12690 [Gammaproteobacteria bacterium]|nr:hypothetical protein [Gammaproteobacteria bacterium]
MKKTLGIFAIILLNACGSGDEKPTFSLNDLNLRQYQAGDTLTYSISISGSANLGTMETRWLPSTLNIPQNVGGDLSGGLLMSSEIKGGGSNTQFIEKHFLQDAQGSLKIFAFDADNGATLWMAPKTGKEIPNTTVTMGETWITSPINESSSNTYTYDVHACRSETDCELLGQAEYKLQYLGIESKETEYATFESVLFDYSFHFLTGFNFTPVSLTISDSNISGRMWIYPPIGVVMDAFSINEKSYIAALNNTSISVPR